MALLLHFFIPALAQAADISTGLIAHWTFNQGSGTSAADSAGSRDGTIAGGGAWVAGKSGKALDFDGVDDFVSYPTNIEFNNGDFTIAGWFKREGTAGGTENNFPIFSQRVDATAPGSAIVTLYGAAGGANGKTLVQLRDNAGALVQVSGTTSITDNQWYHVAVTKSGTTVKIYVNGVLEKTASHSLTGDFDAGANHRLIGKHAWGGMDRSFSNGAIDDVRVYARVLSDADITALYNHTGGMAGDPGCLMPDGDAGVMHFDPGRKALVFCDGRNWVQMGDITTSGTPDLGTLITDGLAAYWRFDQTSGTNAPATPGDAGTLTNMNASTVWVDGKFGKALDFDGVDDFVTYPTNIEFNNGDFTISGWFMREGVSGGPEDNFMIFAQRVDAIGNGNPVVTLTGKGTSGYAVAQIRDNVGAVVTVYGTTVIEDNKWYHVAAVKTASELRLYLNGSREGSMAHSLNGDFDAGAVYRYIGKHRYGGVDQSFANGKIDDVRVYLRALDEAEIKRLYYALGPGCADPSGGPHLAAAGVLVYNDTARVLQYCNGVEWVALGSSALTSGIYNPTGSGSLNDGTPTPFSFANQTNTALNTVITAPAITPAGYNIPVDVTVSGAAGTPEISINGGPWTSAATTINPGQTIAVRMTSANTGATTRTATITIGGVSYVWSVTSLTDTTPNAFTFVDITGAARSTLVTSAPVTIGGIDSPAPVSVTGTGAQVSINGGAWATSGTITNGQTLAVRLTSSASYGTAMTATVDVGGVTDTWSVTTIAADTTPNAFNFADVTGAALSTLTTASSIMISGINVSTPVSVTGTGAQISINGGTWVTSGTITNGQTLAVRLTSSASYGAAMTATVDVGGVTDTWSVTTIGPDTTPNAFDFTPNVSAANLNTLTTAGNTVTISGINSPASVSVSGNGTPQISINGGTWANSGTISNGQTLQLRLTSSGLHGTTHTATVTVGGVTDTWSVTTLGADTTPDAFDFGASVTGINPGAAASASTVTITGINTSTPVSVTGSGAQISIAGGGWVTSGNITNGQTLALRITAGAGFSTTTTATVTVGTANDTWSITTRAANNCTVANGTTWVVSGKTCTAPSALTINHGTTGSRTDSTAPTTGSATWSCSDGTATLQAGATCVQSCAASQAVAWSNCNATSGALLANGASRTVTNTASGYTGTRVITCNNGTLAQSGGSCTASLTWKAFGQGAAYTNCSPTSPAGLACTTAGATCRGYPKPNTIMWTYYRCE